MNPEFLDESPRLDVLGAKDSIFVVCTKTCLTIGGNVKSYTTGMDFKDYRCVFPGFKIKVGKFIHTSITTFPVRGEHNTRAIANPIVILKGQSNSIMEIVFDPDGSILSSIDFDGHLQLWDSVQGVQLAESSNDTFRVWKSVLARHGPSDGDGLRSPSRAADLGSVVGIGSGIFQYKISKSN